MLSTLMCINRSSGEFHRCMLASVNSLLMFTIVNAIGVIKRVDIKRYGFILNIANCLRPSRMLRGICRRVSVMHHPEKDLLYAKTFHCNLLTEYVRHEDSKGNRVVSTFRLISSSKRPMCQYNIWLTYFWILKIIDDRMIHRKFRKHKGMSLRLGGINI